jgi:flagellar assembly factor FliW
MIRVHTTRFSDIEVAEDRIISFPEGLIGFEEHKQFALITRGDSPFVWLQSLKDPALAFVAADPLAFVPDYRPDIDEDTVLSLGAGSEAEVRYLAIAVVPQDPTETTLNLQAPIAVNPATRVARQVVTMNPAHPLKFRLFQAARAADPEDAGAPRVGEG